MRLKRRSGRLKRSSESSSKESRCVIWIVFPGFCDPHCWIDLRCVDYAYSYALDRGWDPRVVGPRDFIGGHSDTAKRLKRFVRPNVLKEVHSVKFRTTGGATCSRYQQVLMIEKAED